MTTFDANIKKIPCVIHLNDDYKIEKITCNDGKWIITVDNDDYSDIEAEHESIISGIKREDDRIAKAYENHIRIESQIVRQI